MYCIYSGKNLDDADMNVEHIIPLSLGGCDSFTIMVGKKINSDLGSKIDGKFCNDFLIGLQQLPFDNKGHSKKSKSVNLKGTVNNRPITWSLSKDGSKFYDHMDKKYLTGQMQVQVKTALDIDIRWKFVCKVALATGYYLFGEDFVKYADCETLRKALLSENVHEEKLDLKIYTNLIPIQDKDKGMHDLGVMLFEYLGGSAVHFGYAPGRIIASVAINGKYIGMVNFKADVDQLPIKNDLHRCGCVLICKDNKLTKKSFWQSIYDMNQDLGLVDISGLDIEF